MLPDSMMRESEFSWERQNRVPNKGCYYELAGRGLLGNTPRAWRNIEEMQRSGFKGRVHIRYATPQSPFWMEDIPAEEIEHAVKDLEKKGARRCCMKFSESLPKEDIVLSGTVSRSEEYYDLYFTREKLNHRNAEARGLMQFTSGLRAYGILKASLCPSSFEDLMAIFDLFPDSIVEFTVYRRNVGLIRGRNTVFWEVRNY